jgi:two-component system cell cycle response regulator
MDGGNMQITMESKVKIGPAVEDGLDVSARPFKILVVDDSPIDRKLLEQALSQEQYTVLSAKSGQEAIQLFAEHRPPLVITDWLMPDLTGIELCQRIRVEFQESYTYIIILTAMTEKDKLVKGLGAGADDYLTKPFHANELLARVGVGRRIADLHRQIEAKSRVLEELALTDAMTGLLNRRGIELWAGRELSAAARHDFPLWAVMADMDNFKSVNDTYGHDAGDAVLKGFAEILKTNTRSADICGRIGGEEFLIVLTHTNRDGATLVVVTASFGIAGHSRHQSQNFNRLVTQADAALYSAKQLGRNRVELAATEINPIESNQGPSQPQGSPKSGQ